MDDRGPTETSFGWLHPKSWQAEHIYLAAAVAASAGFVVYESWAVHDHGLVLHAFPILVFALSAAWALEHHRHRGLKRGDLFFSVICYTIAVAVPQVLLVWTYSLLFANWHW